MRSHPASFYFERSDSMITPAEHDFPAIIKGTVYNPTLYIIVNGSAKDLSECTASLVITESATDTDTILTITESSGLTLGNDGTIEIDIQESTTSTLPTGTAYASLFITEDSETDCYVRGNISIRS